LCGALVFKVGIFEGLLIAMAAHAVVYFLVYNKNDNMPYKEIINRYIEKLKANSKSNLD